MFLVAEEGNSRRSRFNPPLLFISKDMGWKYTAYHIVNSDPGHTRPKQQLDKTLKIIFASVSKSTDEKGKHTKKRKTIAKRHALHTNAKKRIKCNDNVITV